MIFSLQYFIEVDFTLWGKNKGMTWIPVDEVGLAGCVCALMAGGWALFLPGMMSRSIVFLMVHGSFCFPCPQQSNGQFRRSVKEEEEEEETVAISSGFWKVVKGGEMVQA